MYAPESIIPLQFFIIPVPRPPPELLLYYLPTVRLFIISECHSIGLPYTKLDTVTPIPIVQFPFQMFYAILV